MAGRVQDQAQVKFQGEERKVRYKTRQERKYKVQKPALCGGRGTSQLWVQAVVAWDRQADGAMRPAAFVARAPREAAVVQWPSRPD